MARSHDTLSQLTNFESDRCAAADVPPYPKMTAATLVGQPGRDPENIPAFLAAYDAATRVTGLARNARAFVPPMGNSMASTRAAARVPTDGSTMEPEMEVEMEPEMESTMDTVVAPTPRNSMNVEMLSSDSSWVVVDEPGSATPTAGTGRMDTPYPEVLVLGGLAAGSSAGSATAEAERMVMNPLGMNAVDMDRVTEELSLARGPRVDGYVNCNYPRRRDPPSPDEDRDDMVL